MAPLPPVMGDKGELDQYVSGAEDVSVVDVDSGLSGAADTTVDG